MAVIDGKDAAAYVMRSQTEAVLSQLKADPNRWTLTSMPLSGLSVNG